MTTMKADISADAENRLRRGELIMYLFTQTKGQPSPLSEQVIFLFAIRRGLLDLLPQMWQRFKQEIHGWLKGKHPQLIQEIQEKQTLSQELKQTMGQILTEFLHQEK